MAQVTRLNDLPKVHHFVAIVPIIVWDGDKSTSVLQYHQFPDKEELERWIRSNMAADSPVKFKVVEAIPCEVDIKIEVIQKI